MLALQRQTEMDDGSSGGNRRGEQPTEERLLRRNGVQVAIVPVPVGGMPSLDDAQAERAFESWLSAGERRLLSRLRHPLRRAEWLAGRWAARRALTGLLDEACGGTPPPATAVAVLPTLRGAARVHREEQDGRLTTLPLLLALTQRAGLAAAAAARAAQGRRGLGLDLERIEPRAPEFLADHFTPAERALVRAAADPGERERRSAALWALKEAVLGALGDGLHWNRRELELTLTGPRPDGTGEATLRVGGQPCPALRLELLPAPRPDFLLALATWVDG